MGLKAKETRNLLIYGIHDLPLFQAVSIYLRGFRMVDGIGLQNPGFAYLLDHIDKSEL